MKSVIKKIILFLVVSSILLFCVGCSEETNGAIESANTNVEETKNSNEKVNEVETVEEVTETTLQETIIETTENIEETTIPETTKSAEEEMKENKLKKFIEANTIDSILKNYLSFQYYDYELNKDGAKTAFYEGYADRQGNRALRYKSKDENIEYSFQNAPYYVKTDKGKYEVVEGDSSSPLHSTHWINDEKHINKDIIENNFNRKSIISDKSNIISDDVIDGKNILTVEIPFSDDIKMNYPTKVFYSELLGVNDIATFLVEYEYDKNTFCVLKETDIAICSDGTNYVVANITYEYDVNVLTAIKVVNDEEGEVVYFDTKKLEDNNIYSKFKKDLTSFVIKDTKYDINGNVTQQQFIYKDVDGYAVLYDVKVKENNDNLSNPIYHVKYEKKWYDIINGKVSKTSMSESEIKKCEIDPVNSVTGLRSLIDSSEKVITSYEENEVGVIVQEETNLVDDKLYRASILPGIENVNKTRREVRYDMDDDIIKSYVLTSYSNGKQYVVEKCEVLLDENEPRELDMVMDYVDEMEEGD